MPRLPKRPRETTFDWLHRTQERQTNRRKQSSSDYWLLNLATCNVRTMTQDNHWQLFTLMQSLKLDILCIQSALIHKETSHTHRGERFHIHTNHHVGFIVRTNLAHKENPLDTHIQDRIGVMQTQDTTIINVYAPYQQENADDCEAFWTKLGEIIHEYEPDTLFLVGDCNAHIALSDMDTHHQPATRLQQEEHQYASITDGNGEALLELCDQHQLKILNLQRLGTYKSRITCRTNETLNAHGGTIIDYILTRERSEAKLHTNNIKIISPKELYATDHNILMARIQRRDKHVNPWIPKTPKEAIQQEEPATDDPIEQHAQEVRKVLNQLPIVKEKELKNFPTASQELKNAIKLVHRLRGQDGHWSNRARLARAKVRKLRKQATQEAINSMLNDIQKQMDDNNLREAYRRIHKWSRPRIPRAKKPTTKLFFKTVNTFKDILTRNIVANWDEEVDMKPTNRPPIPERGQPCTCYTDGSWDQHEGLGYSAIFFDDKQDFRQYTAYYGPSHSTTEASSTRAEALAILVALQNAPTNNIHLHTDSLNCVRTFSKLRRIMAADFTGIHNADIWRQIAREMATKHVSIHHVRGHKGHPGNETANTYANIGRITNTEINSVHRIRSDENIPELHANIQWQESHINPLYTLEEPITDEEVRVAIAALKPHKAAGPDKVQAQQVKNAEARTHITALIQEIWNIRKLPKSMKEMEMLALPKPGGGARGIALISMLTKVLTRIILNRYADVDLDRSQLGYRKGCNAAQAVLILRCHLLLGLEQQQDRHTIFIDYEKAFDSVGRNILGNMLQSYGVGETAVELIQQLYDDEIHMATGRHIMRFKSLCGVRQGCVLSPWLFALVMNSVIIRTKQQMQEGEIILAYADDVAITTNSRERLQTVLNNFNEYSEDKGLKINLTKTYYMASILPSQQDTEAGHQSRAQRIGIQPKRNLRPQELYSTRLTEDRRHLYYPAPPYHRGIDCPFKCAYYVRKETKQPMECLLAHLEGYHSVNLKSLQKHKVAYVRPAKLSDTHRINRQDTPSAGDITLNGENIKKVEYFKYLGSHIYANGWVGEEISYRAKIASKAMGPLRHVWNGKLTRKVKSRIFETMIIPRLLYGSGTWNITQTELEELQTAYHKLARRAGGYRGILTENGWRKIPGTTVRNQLKLPAVDDLIRQDRLRMYGELIRQKQGTIFSIPLREPYGPGRRGLKHIAWRKLVKEDMNQLQLNVKDAENQLKWKEKTKARRPQ